VHAIWLDHRRTELSADLRATHCWLCSSLLVRSEGVWGSGASPGGESRDCCHIVLSDTTTVGLEWTTVKLGWPRARGSGAKHVLVIGLSLRWIGLNLRRTWVKSTAWDGGSGERSVPTGLRSKPECTSSRRCEI